jgi:hypothetical protein
MDNVTIKNNTLTSFNDTCAFVQSYLAVNYNKYRVSNFVFEANRFGGLERVYLFQNQYGSLEMKNLLIKNNIFEGGVYIFGDGYTQSYFNDITIINNSFIKTSLDNYFIYFAGTTETNCKIQNLSITSNTLQSTTLMKFSKVFSTIISDTVFFNNTITSFSEALIDSTAGIYLVSNFNASSNTMINSVNFFWYKETESVKMSKINLENNVLLDKVGEGKIFKFENSKIETFNLTLKNNTMISL